MLRFICKSVEGIKKVLPGLFYAVLTPSTMRQGCCTSCRVCARVCVCVQPLWPNYANLFNQMQLFPCVYRASFCGCGSAWHRVCSRQRLLRLCCCSAAETATGAGKIEWKFHDFPLLAHVRMSRARPGPECSIFLSSPSFLIFHARENERALVVSSPRDWVA